MLNIKVRGLPQLYALETLLRFSTIENKKTASLELYGYGYVYVDSRLRLGI